MSSEPSKTRKRAPSDYTFKEKLGEGSYSKVYLAIDQNDGQAYAVKVLSKQHIITEKKTKYVNIEKDTLNRLAEKRHPGVVTLYYTFHDPQNLYFVLDLASNGELLALINRMGSFSTELARYYMAQILDAVGYMHSRGVIHRDLKPENILLDANMRVLITDFGAAKLEPLGGHEMVDVGTNGDTVAKNIDATAQLADLSISDAPRKSSFVGTAEYVSPELLQYNKCSFASDVWAIGCILYQFYTGRVPFRGSNEYSTFEKIVTLQYSYPYPVDNCVTTLVSRILVLDPTQRYTIEQIMRDEWLAGVDWSQIWTQPVPKIESQNRLPALRHDGASAKNVVISRSKPIDKKKQLAYNIMHGVAGKRGQLQQTVQLQSQPVTYPTAPNVSSQQHYSQAQQGQQPQGQYVQQQAPPLAQLQSPMRPAQRAVSNMQGQRLQAPQIPVQNSTKGSPQSRARANSGPLSRHTTRQSPRKTGAMAPPASAPNTPSIPLVAAQLVAQSPPAQAPPAQQKIVRPTLPGGANSALAGSSPRTRPVSQSFASRPRFNLQAGEKIIKQGEITVYELGFPSTTTSITDSILHKLITTHATQLAAAPVVGLCVTTYARFVLSDTRVFSLMDADLSMYDYEFDETAKKGYLILEKFRDKKLYFFGHAPSAGPVSAKTWVDSLFRAKEMVEAAEASVSSGNSTSTSASASNNASAPMSGRALSSSRAEQMVSVRQGKKNGAGAAAAAAFAAASAK